MRLTILFILFFTSSCVSSNSLYEPNKTDKNYFLISTADAYVGMDERTNRTVLKSFMGIDPVRTEWCAAFINSVLRKNGIAGSESVSNHPLTARSFLHWGEEVKEPRPGDIVVFPRGNQGWQGHVGFYVTSYIENGTKYYIILGGNQNDKVSYQKYNAKKAISIRRWPDEREK